MNFTFCAIFTVTLLFFTQIFAAPKYFRCISYLEDDRTSQDDEYLDENVSSSSQVNAVEKQESDKLDSVSAPAPNESHIRTCPLDYMFCFSLWRQTENGTHIVKQGCWKESTERNATCSQTQCLSSAPTTKNNSLYYCCCSGDNCNQKVAVIEPSPLKQSREIDLKDRRNKVDDEQIWYSGFIWLPLFALCAILSIVTATFYCRKAKTITSFNEDNSLSPNGPKYSSNLRNVDNLSLVCMIGNGKYGTVMKGLLHNQEVAVKIFSESNYQTFVNERNIYSLPHMESPALLTYYGYDERQTLEGKTEYHLVLSLAPLGCLQDWLIANIMDFETFCLMAKSITRGLSHLHTEVKIGDKLKPCVAHRDLNSRNILVKADRSCCIADFGFALKVFGSKYEYKGEVATAETKSINEVGTLRYMSPELLEGAVNLRDCETSLKQMDVYALGLVLWELSTRCSDFYSNPQITPSYKASYELEVGTHPTFDQMQTLVLRHKARPLFPTGWGGGAASKLIKDTCEDCWDHDAEARLTSLCAEERMQEVSGLRPRLNISASNGSQHPLLNANNLIVEQIEINPKPAHLQNTEAITNFSPPPNQLVLPTIEGAAAENDVEILQNLVKQKEKNHLVHMSQLQPYQGRNPCQERNLAPITTRPPQVLIQRSKKHTFHADNSFSCIEDDISVEDLIAGSASAAKLNVVFQNSNMGQGFPKQHNTDKKLSGWHGVRALIQKNLFRKTEEVRGEQFNQHQHAQQHQADEKSSLMDNRFIAAIKDLEETTNKYVNTNKNETLKMLPKRPSNLDLNFSMEQNNDRDFSKYESIDSVFPRNSSRSFSNSKTVESELNTLTHSNKDIFSPDSQVRKQRSLEVFREVFNARNNTEKLRNVSQRVKTPGDVPPSVRKIRASKTLSLYDDRMMDSSALDIL